MEPVHVKLGFEEAVNSKGSLLSTEINLLTILKNIQTYKKLRKTELSDKIKIRASIKKIIAEIKSIKESLPKTKSPEKEKKEAKVEIQKMAKGTKLEAELKDIRERLEKLARVSSFEA